MKDYIQKGLGRRIQELRKDANLSQEKLAEKLGIAVNTLSNIERGRAFMTAQTLENIVNILKIKPQELFTFQEINSEDDLYEYIIEKIDSIKDNKYKLETLKKFIKFVL